MTTKPKIRQPILVFGADLENWRISNQLSKTEAADALGLPMSKWYGITNPDLKAKINSSQVILDKTIVTLFLLYQKYPKAMPRQEPTDITTFYNSLGFQDNLKDKEKFSKLIGRSVATVYRMVDTENLEMTGNPGRPVQCLIDAVQRLGEKESLTPQDKLNIMTEIEKLSNQEDFLKGKVN